MRLPGQIFKDGLSKPLGIVRLDPVEVLSKWLHDYRGAIDQFHNHAVRSRNNLSCQPAGCAGGAAG